MKIGVDIDGVLIDFEERFRCKASIFDFYERKGILSKLNDNYWIEEKYGWSQEQYDRFAKKYLIQLTKESILRPGAEEVLKLLKKEGHELIVISARGTESEEMITLVKEKINKSNIEFDNYYWKTPDKLQVCFDEKIDIMIDDNPITCEKLAKNHIKTFYFKNTYGKDLKEDIYLKEVCDWGDIYRKISSKNKILF